MRRVDLAGSAAVIPAFAAATDAYDPYLIGEGIVSMSEYLCNDFQMIHTKKLGVSTHGPRK